MIFQLLELMLALNPNGGNVGIGTDSPGAKLEINRVTVAEPSAIGATTLLNSVLSVTAAGDTNTRLMAGIGNSAYTWIQSKI